jgi:tRNA (cytidine/uridine-2'-O-)-methyltransferase
MRIALYQPEIAGNVGAVLRLAACLGVPVDLIEPMGFAWDDRRVRRAAMDYIDHVTVCRHPNWKKFTEETTGRLVLMSSKADCSLYDVQLQAGDVLLFGRESAGVPHEVANACALRVRIPLRPEVRSFNLAISAAIAASEALRQTGGLPE